MGSMASSRSVRHCQLLGLGFRTERIYFPRQSRSNTCLLCRERAVNGRHFSASSARRKGASQNEKASFTSRLRAAFRDTKVQWYPIPVGLGIGFLGLLQFNRVQRRERLRREEEEDSGYGSGDGGDGNGGKPKKRKRIRPNGPWYGATTFL